MTQTALQRMVPQAPMVTIIPTDVPNPIGRQSYTTWTAMLFGAITTSALIVVPLYGYFYHYIWLDWSLFGLLSKELILALYSLGLARSLQTGSFVEESHARTN
ncbi:MAG TPA: hypothetical protein VJU54_00635 [Nitrospiraceae bacterium]|nr:hypothetical protein [Nitrospiraceae bacterium]